MSDNVKVARGDLRAVAARGVGGRYATVEQRVAPGVDDGNGPSALADELGQAGRVGDGVVLPRMSGRDIVEQVGQQRLVAVDVIAPRASSSQRTRNYVQLIDRLERRDRNVGQERLRRCERNTVHGKSECLLEPV